MNNDVCAPLKHSKITLSSKMNKIETHKLTQLLNYDSNHKRVLSWEQRVLVHQLISRNLAPNPKRVYLPIPTKTFYYIKSIIATIEIA